MNANLEDRLHNLADDLSAPPTDAAREAIGRRTGKLRRRRQTRRAVGAGVLVVSLVAGLAALSSLRNSDEGTYAGQPDVSTGQPESGLPAWTLELDGWEIAGPFEEFQDVAAETCVAGNAFCEEGGGAVQLFRRGDDPIGPTVVLRHGPAGDVEVPHGETVEIGSAQGSLEQVGPERFALYWNPDNGDSRAGLESSGLTRTEVLAFADGLEPYDDEISYPPTSEDRFGFEASELPADLQPVSLEPTTHSWSVRRIDYRRGEETVSVTVDDRGRAAFDAQVASWLVQADEAREVDVAGNRAYLFQLGSDGTIFWEQDGFVVEVDVIPVEVTTVDEVIARLRHVTEEELAALEASVE